MPNPDNILICMDCGCECKDVTACPECGSDDLLGLEEEQYNRKVNEDFEFAEDMKMFKESGL